MSNQPFVRKDQTIEDLIAELVAPMPEVTNPFTVLTENLAAVPTTEEKLAYLLGWALQYIPGMIFIVTDVDNPGIKNRHLKEETLQQISGLVAYLTEMPADHTATFIKGFQECSDTMKGVYEKLGITLTKVSVSDSASA